jgi:serine protease Do
VMDQILKNGKVVRGYIGVIPQEVTPTLAKAFNVPAERGALVGDVESNSPGAKAGLQRGDVVTELNGQPVDGPNDLRLKVGTMTPGTTLHLKVDRAGQSHDINVVLGEVPSEKSAANERENSAGASPLQGVQVQDLTDDIRQQIGVPSGTKGVVVSDVANSSPAADTGLQRGDVIEQINHQNVTSVSDYQRIIERAGKQELVLLVNRGGNTTFLVVQPE